MSRPLLNRRLAGLGTTIFAEMSARALVTGSVNLGQGFPDRDGPAKIAQVAADAILAGRGNQYPPGPGVPELRQAIAAHDERFYGLRYDPDGEILVTAGATEAIAAASPEQNGPSSGSAAARRSEPNLTWVASGNTARSAPEPAAWPRAALTRSRFTEGRELTGIWHSATRMFAA